VVRWPRSSTSECSSTPGQELGARGAERDVETTLSGFEAECGWSSEEQEFVANIGPERSLYAFDENMTKS